MTDITDSKHSFAASPPAARKAASRRDEADGPFLRRILIGLVAATVISGALALGLTSQHELIEGMQVASMHGPA